MNNLKMLALAMHNYHDTYGRLPAAFNTDEDGKPLLSWRVHILPFVEATELYDQFHLDEPWDSEHNLRLIPQMPPVYKSPGSNAEPGKTVYLGVRHKQGILVPPAGEQQGKTVPTGVRFAEITDGLSNTLLAVEANDQNAVIWTRPDDLEPDSDNISQDLIGIRPGGFLVVLCDGSVRRLAATVSNDALKALLTRDGGEVDVWR